MDNVGNVLDESPAKLANSILLFCKGLGWLTSVDLPGVERRSSTGSNVSTHNISRLKDSFRPRTLAMKGFDRKSKGFFFF